MTETINFKTQLDALSEISYNLQLAGVQLYHQKHMIIQSLTILDYNYKLGFFSGACNIVNLNINFFFNCMDYMYQSKTKIYTFINKLVSCQIFDTHEYTVSFISFAYETFFKSALYSIVSVKKISKESMPGHICIYVTILIKQQPTPMFD